MEQKKTYVADLHIHSKYSRATSRECDPHTWTSGPVIKAWTWWAPGDFTHAKWREELKEALVPEEEGFYTLKEECRLPPTVGGEERRPRFVVTGEISSIYKKNGKTRKVHNVILLPSLEEGDKLAHRLEAIGNLHSDGTPHSGPGLPRSAGNHLGVLPRGCVYPRPYLDAAFFPFRRFFRL